MIITTTKIITKLQNKIDSNYPDLSSIKTVMLVTR